MFTKAVAFCALLVLASAFVEIANLDPIPDKYKDQEGCYIKELDKVIALGQTIPSKERCVWYRCSQTFVHIEGCGAIGVAPGCHLEEEKEKPYPLCCPTLKCKTEAQ